MARIGDAVPRRAGVVHRFDGALFRSAPQQVVAARSDIPLLGCQQTGLRVARRIGDGSGGLRGGFGLLQVARSAFIRGAARARRGQVAGERVLAAPLVEQTVGKVAARLVADGAHIAVHHLIRGAALGVGPGHDVRIGIEIGHPKVVAPHDGSVGVLDGDDGIAAHTGFENCIDAVLFGSGDELLDHSGDVLPQEIRRLESGLFGRVADICGEFHESSGSCHIAVGGSGDFGESVDEFRRYGDRSGCGTLCFGIVNFEGDGDGDGRKDEIGGRYRDDSRSGIGFGKSRCDRVFGLVGRSRGGQFGVFRLTYRKGYF